MSSYVPATVRVYLLDDHDIVRRGLRDLLAPAPDVEVVGDSGLVRVADEAILRLAPDVMLLDLQLADGSGIEVCRRVRSVDPSIRGLILTAAGDDDALVATVLGGAAGYVVKLVGATSIAHAIRRAGRGRSMLDDRDRERALELARTRLAAATPGPTAAEVDLLEQVLSGATDAELATRLGRPRPEVGDSVARLVRRLVAGLTEEPPRGVPATPGRHRREV